ncbi:Bax inhibitor-1/YccA family protein [Pectinatus cerevisiiphilus]|uniref:Putative YccA/Bax inhibitor family protein n=1 Tax=Pectinatus cerevisiiphilus TaxID=86956 RepID=A0A4R3KE43_9FIRM|nr:Bax inhibitor-1/YccA family protein [Pectinatus cerevisiiphilus]TCS80911.1 putative YccA/Bax inhibitor family protein [Pectinatus cerevisiiphilus]
MANPVIRVMEKENENAAISFGQTATLSGSLQKSIGLVVLTIISAVASAFFLADTSFAFLGMGAGFIGGFVLAMVTCFKPSISEYTAPGYAVFEGMALGIISMQFEQFYFGISAIAVGVTFAVMITMLVLWKTGVITVTEKVRSAIISMTLAIAVFYFANFIASLFGADFMPRTGILGIVISLIISAVAAFNLLIDFDNIEKAVSNGMPKYMEYFTAFGLLITLVWLYVEILRMIAMIVSVLQDN